MECEQELDLKKLSDEIKKDVIGQDEAVDWLCSFVDTASYRARLIEGGADSAALPSISSALLVGPTASGKTHLIKTYARKADFLCHEIDAGSMTGEGWRGNSFSNEWGRIAQRLDENPGKMAIVFIDEVDKIQPDNDRDKGFSPKFDLLKPLEGGMLEGLVQEGTESRRFLLDCDRCIFVFSGAFTGIDALIEKRTAGSCASGVGFSTEEQVIQTEEDLRAQITLEDIEAWGFPRELVGRISTVKFMPALGRDALRQITKNLEPKFSNMLPGGRFAIEDGAIEFLIDAALDTNYGARSLNQQLNRVFGEQCWPKLRSEQGTGIAEVRLTCDDSGLSCRFVYGKGTGIDFRKFESSEARRVANLAYELLAETERVATSGKAFFNPSELLSAEPGEYAAALLCSEDGAAGAHDYSYAEILLLHAMIYLLSDWFSARDFRPKSLAVLLSMAETDLDGYSALDLLYQQIQTGQKYVRNPEYDDDSSQPAWVWVDSKFVRNQDGACPAESEGLGASEDRALGCYEEFTNFPRQEQKDAVLALSYRLLPFLAK